MGGTPRSSRLRSNWIHRLTHVTPHFPTRLAGDRTHRWTNTHLPTSSCNGLDVPYEPDVHLGFTHVGEIFWIHSEGEIGFQFHPATDVELKVQRQLAGAQEGHALGHDPGAHRECPGSISLEAQESVRVLQHVGAERIP